MSGLFDLSPSVSVSLMDDQNSGTLIISCFLRCGHKADHS